MSNPAAEKAILASLFHYGNKAYIDFADITHPDMFTSETNTVLFKCFAELLKDEKIDYKPDIASVLSVANKLGLSEYLEKDKRMMMAISNFHIELENVRKQCAIVYKLYLARKGASRLEASRDLLFNLTGEEPISDIRRIVEELIDEFTKELTSNKSDTIRKIGLDAYEYMEFLANNPVDTVGVATGFKEFDKAIGGGLRRKTVSLVGARTKAGKTQFADNTGIYIASGGFPDISE